MNKKIIVLGIVGVLIFAVGGFFWWNGGQKDVRELNKNLPKGVRVVKSLFGEEYKVVNKIDGYEFKAPKEWRGVRNIEYYKSEKNTNRIILENLVGNSIIVDRYLKEEKLDIELKSWIADFYKNLSIKFGEALRQYQTEEEHLGSYKLVKVKEGEGEVFYVVSYFFQSNSTIYEVRGMLAEEESIRDIVLNGKW